MSTRAPHITILLATAVALASSGCAAAHEEDASGAQTTTPATTASAESAATPAKTATKKKPDLTRLPLGDGKTTTKGPRRGYIYSCQTYNEENGGAGTDGPWIGSKTFDYTKKAIVDGKISWPNARVSFKVSGGELDVTGNALPVGATTGSFPIASSDDAYTYDRNPNSIASQTVNLALPSDPKVGSSPQCIGGEVGIATNGVPIFTAVDAGGRDAVAHETQDSCAGHPQVSGIYHYHSGSPCLIKGSKAKGLVGWALDGFPIFGPRDSKGNYLTNADLDACHGRTEKVTLNGKKVKTYVYRVTYEFPYTAGCFKGTPSQKQVIPGQAGGQGGPGGPPPGP
jgi:YHYH protein